MTNFSQLQIAGLSAIADDGTEKFWAGYVYVRSTLELQTDAEGYIF